MNSGKTRLKKLVRPIIFLGGPKLKMNLCEILVRTNKNVLLSNIIGKYYFESQRQLLIRVYLEQQNVDLAEKAQPNNKKKYCYNNQTASI